MHKFTFVEHTADIAVELVASSLEELFICAEEAWRQSVFENDEINPEETKSISLTAGSAEELLVDFLSELNYLVLTKKWFCITVQSLKIINEDEIKLLAELSGLNISEREIHFREEIKAITYHQLKIEKENDFFRTKIVFDI